MFGTAILRLPYVTLTLPVGVLSKRMDESSWFWHGGFLPPIVRKFGYLQKSGHFPLELFPKLRTFKNFATASRSSCQQNSSSSSSTVERVDNRRVVAVYYKLVNCNSQTPLGLLRFLVDSLYNLFLQLTRDFV